MNQGERILNEKDPFLRQFWDMGYVAVFRDDCREMMTLLHDNGSQITLSFVEMSNFWHQYTVRRALLIDLTYHYFVSHADGSEERFRAMVESWVDKTPRNSPEKQE
jgi:hypothetical protein